MQTSEIIFLIFSGLFIIDIFTNVLYLITYFKYKKIKQEYLKNFEEYIKNLKNENISDR